MSTDDSVVTSVAFTEPKRVVVTLLTSRVVCDSMSRLRDSQWSTRPPILSSIQSLASPSRDGAGVSRIAARLIGNDQRTTSKTPRLVLSAFVAGSYLNATEQRSEKKIWAWQTRATRSLYRSSNGSKLRHTHTKKRSVIISR